MEAESSREVAKELAIVLRDKKVDTQQITKISICMASGTIRQILIRYQDGACYIVPRRESCEDTVVSKVYGEPDPGHLAPVQPMTETVADRPIPVVTVDSACAVDILATIEEAGHRLTTAQILTEMEKQQKIWGESTVKLWLSKLVKSGKLNNRNERPCPGYGLPGWN